MERTLSLGGLLAAAVTVVWISAAGAGDVNIGINVGAPPPPAVVVASPPALVGVPATYYKIPPGQAKKMEAGVPGSRGRGKGHGRKGGDDR